MVDPRRLIGLLRDRFVAAGGAIYERTSFRSAEYAKDGISVRCGRVSSVRRRLNSLWKDCIAMAAITECVGCMTSANLDPDGDPLGFWPICADPWLVSRSR